MIQIKYRFIDDERPRYEPIKGSKYAAAFDLYYGEKQKEIVIEPYSTRVIGTNLKLEIPSGYYGQIETRSSSASKGCFITGGIVDSDYRGEIFIVLNTHSNAEVLERGYRIAQLIIHPVLEVELLYSNELSETKRGDGGFGSTNNVSEAPRDIPFF